MPTAAVIHLADLTTDEATIVGCKRWATLSNDVSTSYGIRTYRSLGGCGGT